MEEGDRDSPAAKTQRLDPSPVEMSETQIDGQADEEEKPEERQLEKDISMDKPEIEKSKDEESLFARPSTSASCKQDLESDSGPKTPVKTEKPQSEEKNCIYHVKWIGWGPKRIGIITQNENGPCPLLSIINVLLLRGKLTLPDGCEVISAEQLLEYLGNLISESVPGNLADDNRLNYEQNMSDAICILPKLQTGLDVNVRFTGVGQFEYTPECIIFDLMDIPLYHGWLIDPQMEEVVSAVKAKSYNQLVEMIISNKTSRDSEKMSKSLIAEQFLEESASQLTYHGLCELNSAMKDGELAVFFRNNHFSTIFKKKMELFLLVTDQGFLKENRVVWETLNTIDGDNQFVDDGFMTVPPVAEEPAKPSINPANNVPVPEGQQIDQDLQLAITLSQAEEREAGEWEEYKRAHLGDTTGLSDEQLAQRLQEAEENLAAQDQRQQDANSEVGPQIRAPPRQRARARQPIPQGQPEQSQLSRSRNCVIL